MNSSFKTYDLVVLDYSDSSVHIYHVLNEIEASEDLIASLGFNLDNVYWMSGNIEVTKHRRMIKEVDNTED